MKLLVILLSALSVTSCMHVPPPQPEVCTHDFSRRRFICYDNRTNQSRVLYYEKADKYVALSPDDYTEILMYLDMLSDGTHCEGD